MNAPQMYVDSLRILYDDRKIGVSKCSPSFACRHLDSCKAAAEPRKLRNGSEAYIGDKYGDPIRLVVVSLDTGGGAEDEKREDNPMRWKGIEELTFDGANRHMKGTIQTLQHLYGCKPESDLLPRFAMINSAKCSGKDNDKSMVPGKLYENCRDHGLAELGVLNPQLVVTQGAKAKDLLACWAIDQKEIQEHMPSLIWGDVDVGSWICTQVKEHLKYWKNGNQCVPVLQCPHPSARGGQWQRFKKTMLPTVAHVIRQWLPDLASL